MPETDEAETAAADEAMEKALAVQAEIAEAKRGSRRMACAVKGCYEENGHDGATHGLRVPPSTNRMNRRGNNVRGRQRHR